MAEEYDLIILNGIVVTDTEVQEWDIAIKDEKIAKILPRGGLKDVKATRTIDAEGGHIMPGGVDAHVHLQEPPLFGKGSTADNYETGTTHERAKGNCYIDYSFHLLVGNPSENALSEFKTLREQGISSLKIYMTYEALELRDGQILHVLLGARKQGITTMVHAENGQVIDWMTAQLERQKLFAPKYYGLSHPPMAEIKATYRAISLSEFMGSPILIVHVSTPAAAAHIKAAQDRGIPIFAETCPQYLFLTKRDLDQPGFQGAKCVCSPPPRESEADCDVIWDGLANGTFTILLSDHCPIRYDDAEMGKKSSVSVEYPVGHFKYIPNGCLGIEIRLALTLSADFLDVKQFVEVTSANPAKLYGLYPLKGALVEGVSDADINIWYLLGKMEEFALTNNMLHHD